MSDHRKSRQKPQEAAGGHSPDAATKDTPPNTKKHGSPFSKAVAGNPETPPVLVARNMVIGYIVKRFVPDLPAPNVIAAAERDLGIPAEHRVTRDAEEEKSC